MGCTLSSLTPEEASARANSVHIDSVLRVEQKLIKPETKLLLLGTGDSGKTTVLKQLRLSYGTAFNTEEILEFRSVVLTNLIKCGKILVLEMDRLQIPYGFKAEAYHDVSSRLSMLDEQRRVQQLARDAFLEAGGVQQGGEMRLFANTIKVAETPYGFAKDESIGADLLVAIEKIWGDQGVKYCYSRRNQFTVPLLENCSQ
ncbi:hypothetical protein HDU98_007561 [Podochytrium sp. JEL0797]|nr:hypothetical protein HDU98_007561 [Podochytrium sp. JEL0797]